MSLFKTERKSFLIAFILSILVAIGWTWAIKFVVVDQHQGEVYRIIYLHVPIVFTAFLNSFILFIISVLGLWKKSEKSALYGKACAEVGLLFTLLTLATGSIWGKPTWGTWWTWDARLTTTFILALLYSGYLLLWSSMGSGALRIKVTSILGVLIFSDVPIIYKSVTWWRTLHQAPSIMRPKGSTMAPEMLSLLLINVSIMILVGLWIMYERAKNLKLAEQVDQASYEQLAKGGV